MFTGDRTVRAVQSAVETMANGARQLQVATEMKEIFIVLWWTRIWSDSSVQQGKELMVEGLSRGSYPISALLPFHIMLPRWEHSIQNI